MDFPVTGKCDSKWCTLVGLNLGFTESRSQIGTPQAQTPTFKNCSMSLCKQPYSMNIQPIFSKMRDSQNHDKLYKMLCTGIYQNWLSCTIARNILSCTVHVLVGTLHILHTTKYVLLCTSSKNLNQTGT